jgi:hypothetical protein
VLVYRSVKVKIVLAYSLTESLVGEVQVLQRQRKLCGSFDLH